MVQKSEKTLAGAVSVHRQGDRHPVPKPRKAGLRSDGGRSGVRAEVIFLKGIYFLTEIGSKC